MGVFVNLTKHIVSNAKPSFVVIALGSNDAWRDRNTSVDSFRSQYESLVRIALRSGAPIVVTTIPPVEANKPLGDKSFSTEKIVQFNLEIIKIAKEKRLTLVDSAREFTGIDGFAVKGATIDGIHFSAQTYRSWVHELVTAVESKSVACNSGIR